MRTAAAARAAVAGLVGMGLTGCVVSISDNAPDQAEAATAELPGLLRGMAAEIATLSDQLSRRYFALLPPARAVGVDVGEAAVLTV